MTEPTALPPPEPTPSEHLDAQPPEPPASPARSSLLPWLTGAGFLIVAAALFWVWRHSIVPPQAAVQIDALTRQVVALQARLTELERRPAPPDSSDLAPLTARVTALEQRLPQGVDLARLTARVTALEQHPQSPSSDLAPLAARVTTLEQRPASQAAASPPPPDLAPLEARITQLEAKQEASTHWATRVGTLENTEQTLQADFNRQMRMDETRLAANEKAHQQAAHVQAASLALAAGQRLGNLGAAPPALARFANVDPPTEAALRLAFPDAAREALAASRPATEGKPALARLWAEAQELVTIRQGDHVLVGDPAAGTLERARIALNAGDLAGAAAEIATLQGAAAKAMAEWLTQARALLEARAALVAWAASG
jgi:hypothetical protein